MAMVVTRRSLMLLMERYLTRLVIGLIDTVRLSLKTSLDQLLCRVSINDSIYAQYDCAFAILSRL